MARFSFNATMAPSSCNFSISRMSTDRGMKIIKTWVISKKDRNSKHLQPFIASIDYRTKNAPAKQGPSCSRPDKQNPNVSDTWDWWSSYDALCKSWKPLWVAFLHVFFRKSSSPENKLGVPVDCSNLVAQPGRICHKPIQHSRMLGIFGKRQYLQHRITEHNMSICHRYNMLMKVEVWVIATSTILTTKYE